MKKSLQDLLWECCSHIYINIYSFVKAQKCCNTCALGKQLLRWTANYTGETAKTGSNDKLIIITLDHWKIHGFFQYLCTQQLVLHVCRLFGSDIYWGQFVWCYIHLWDHDIANSGPHMIVFHTCVQGMFAQITRFRDQGNEIAINTTSSHTHGLRIYRGQGCVCLLRFV